MTPRVEFAEGEKTVLTAAAKRAVDKLKLMYDGVENIERGHLLDSLAVQANILGESYCKLLEERLYQKYQGKITDPETINPANSPGFQSVFNQGEKANFAQYVEQDAKRLEPMFEGITTKVAGTHVKQLVAYRGQIVSNFYRDHIFSGIALEAFAEVLGGKAAAKSQQPTTTAVATQEADTTQPHESEGEKTAFVLRDSSNSGSAAGVAPAMT